MYSFKNDYSEGAHESILQALVATNRVQTSGYGEDLYTEEAISLIKRKMECEEAQIHFFVGGTQTNLTAISAFLRPHEAAIAATSGHIAVHETGAIEATGHKVLTVSTPDGKLTPEHIEALLLLHTDEHMVKPKLVYISNSTEIGSIYKKAELEVLYKYCKERKLYLFLDGARLGSALMSSQNDMSFPDLARLTDAFYIGGTKNGALMGEALVLINPELMEDFRFHIKQKGALLAKGRLLAINFIELFKEDLFFELADHANKMAQLLDKGIKEAGYSFLFESTTNQLFPIFTNECIAQLSKKFEFSTGEIVDEQHTAIRLVTSWATKKEEAQAFIDYLLSISK